MKAITTKFYGPTNTKPSRIKASAEGVKSTFYTDTDHKTAAVWFAQDNNWPNRLAHGQLGVDTWAHCFTSEAANKTPQ